MYRAKNTIFNGIKMATALVFVIDHFSDSE